MEHLTFLTMEVLAAGFGFCSFSAAAADAATTTALISQILSAAATATAAAAGFGFCFFSLAAAATTADAAAITNRGCTVGGFAA